jgi:plastocyanin
MFRSFAGAVLLTGAAGYAQAADITVTMAGADYAPASLAARVGDRLVFVNDDVLDHNVFVPTAGHGVDLGKQPPGNQTELSLGKAGSFEIECVIHPGMRLAVQVTE